MMESIQQEFIDKFYWSTGPCCAGCDHWRSLNSLLGECRKSPPAPGVERAGSLGIESCSALIPAGHVLTKRDHKCGAFEDTFDWSILPLSYRRRVGELA